MANPNKFFSYASRAIRYAPQSWLSSLLPAREPLLTPSFM
jgi:hypothetical protein